MLKSFADKESERIWNGQHSKRLPITIQQRALNKLAMMSQAADLNDLKIPPANRLEALKGDRSGQFSIRINQPWRICFRWKDGDAYEVKITDYHYRWFSKRRSGDKGCLISAPSRVNSQISIAR